MTKLPDDQIDPYEPRLTRRVGAFAEQAVRPIDPTAIAAAAAAGARRRTIAGRLFGSMSSTARLGVVLAGALLAAGVLGALGAGALNGPGPTQTTAAVGPEATPTSVPGAVEACAPAALSGEIVAWEGAAGHRIATIKVHNTGSSACTVPTQLRPALVDQSGNALIVGSPAQATESITLNAGAAASALVDMTNYCGADPSAPLGIRLNLPSDQSIEAYPAAGVRLPIDPPPCNGPNAASTIEMQPLQVTAAGQ
jgi:Protein of unknown function (DUF4232)